MGMYAAILGFRQSVGRFFLANLFVRRRDVFALPTREVTEEALAAGSCAGIPCQTLLVRLGTGECSSS